MTQGGAVKLLSAFTDIFGDGFEKALNGPPPVLIDQPYQVIKPKPNKIKQDWLEFEVPSDILESTDIQSNEWVADNAASCTNHSTNPEHAFWHPNFAFKDPLHAVRVRLNEVENGHFKKALWDVIFAGGPGPPNKVLNRAVPAGGKLPLFPQFCPPLKPDARYELRLTHQAIDPPSRRFDERLFLRAKRSLPRTWKVPEGELVPPRPPLKRPSAINSGPVHNEPVLIDPETGKPMTIASFL
eukprot:TRINITY_DN42477_c0_g1_i1.p1 TRINITY_DN42477_c0_g1~~TRINITY_DN42477_c0_g1_i1.p1  ORF type:complete len:241 (-),score=41.00 TRINITY_DN42477_c0_g1_i1:66-788(-)